MLPRVLLSAEESWAAETVLSSFTTSNDKPGLSQTADQTPHCRHRIWNPATEY